EVPYLGAIRRQAAVGLDPVLRLDVARERAKLQFGARCLAEELRLRLVGDERLQLLALDAHERRAGGVLLLLAHGGSFQLGASATARMIRAPVRTASAAPARL